MDQSPTDTASGQLTHRGDGSARRMRLREFQTQLVERMQAAGSGALDQERRLGLAIGQMHCLLNLQEAGEIVSVGTLTAVPLTQDWFLGLTNIRGNLVSVVDLARFAGLPPTPVDKESRIVAFAPALSFNGGLLVSRVLGLRNVAGMQPHEERAQDEPAWVVRRYRDQDARVWIELDLSAIVQDPRFLHVGV